MNKLEQWADEILSKAGPYIGPKGGKWADPKHTIPWKEKKGRKKKPAAHEGHVVDAHVDSYSRSTRKHDTERSIWATVYVSDSDTGVHKYEITTPFKPRSDFSGSDHKKLAIKMAIERHNAKQGTSAKHVKNWESKRRKAGRAEASKTQASAGKHRIATGVGAGYNEVDTVAEHGHYAVHHVGAGVHAITHKPSGMKVSSQPNKAIAIKMARHMHKEAGDALGDLGLGQQPGKKHKKDIDKLRAAFQSFRAMR